MSSNLSTAHENEQATATQSNESCTLSQQWLRSSVASTPTPLLHGQMLTYNDHEDNLRERIDELIRNFLSGPNRRYPYRTLFRWTVDDEPNFKYSVVVTINESPAPV